VKRPGRPADRPVGRLILLLEGAHPIGGQDIGGRPIPVVGGENEDTLGHLFHGQRLAQLSEVRLDAEARVVGIGVDKGNFERGARGDLREDRYEADARRISLGLRSGVGAQKPDGRFCARVTTTQWGPRSAAPLEKLTTTDPGWRGADNA
jgi:hypothetical protein